MHPTVSKFPRPAAYRTAGSALLVTLGILVLLTMVVIAFFTSATSERQSAQSFSTASKARVLADSAVRTVMAQIREATTRGPRIAWASQPGMIRNYDDQGRPAGYAKLYSWDNMLATTGSFDPNASAEIVPAGPDPGQEWFNRPNEFVDLNEPLNGNYPIADPGAIDANAGIAGSVSQGAVDEFRLVNPPLNSANGSNPLPMPVKWLYVLQDGGLVAPTGTSNQAVTVSGASVANPIVGRIAFWADDDTAKVNINTASEGTFWDVPRGYSRRTPPGSSSTRSVEFDLAYRRPLLDEYQRYPGHPATTSLSAVFGAWFPKPQYGTDGAPSNWEQVKAIFDLTPRYADGGSRGGTTRTADQASLAVPRKAERLYASRDEIVYAGGDRAAATIAEGVPPGEIARRTKFFVTSANRAPDINLFGRPRVTVWPVFETETKSTAAGARPAQTAADRLIKFCSSLGQNRDLYLFQRRDNKSPTADARIPRNGMLLAYLRDATSRNVPGFGASFESKWGAPERDQILANVFDFIRTTNLNDPALADPDRNNTSQVAGTYTDTILDKDSWHAWENDTTSPGQVIPAKISGTLPGALGQNQPPMSAKGPGRFAVMESATLVFYCDRRTVDPASNPVLSSATTSIRAALVFSWHHPMDGYMTVYNRFRVEVAEVPDPASSRVTVANVSSPGDRPLNYADAAIVGGDRFQFFVTGTARVLATGAQPSDNTRRYGGSHSIFPTTRVKDRTVSFSSNPSQAFETVSANAILVRGNPSTEFTRIGFTGATFRVDIYAQDPAGSPDDTRVQSITLRFPPMQNLPVPGPLKAGNAGFFFSDFRNSSAGRPLVYSEPWTPATTSGTHGEVRRHRIDQAARSQGGITVEGQTRPVPDLVGGETADITLTNPTPGDPGRQTAFRLYCGDIVKSLVPIHGDFRVIACQESVGADVYVPLPGYAGPGSPGDTDPVAAANSHSIRTGVGFAYLNFYTGNRDRVTGLASIGRLRSGVNWSTAGDYLPFLPPHIADLSAVPTEIRASGNYPTAWTPGDWTTCAGNNLDGAYFAHPDEGNLNSTSDEDGRRPPYFGWGHQRVFANATSPNLQIASPVAFGSLPTGAFRNRPWQTLLFRPSTGDPGHPGAASPKDHLFLDLFTMPAAEPYAISEPFSTAGRVNLNYDIVPFRYIKRDTGIRAVLQNERVTAIGSAFGGLKNGGNPGTNDANYPANMRLEVDVQETLKGFERRFADGQIFRSATELCDLHIVPKGATEAGMRNFWDAHAMTGDNLKELPYARAYPRVTTKSNTFTVHYRVQLLKKRRPASDADARTFDPRRGDRVEAEYRGATTIERYVNPDEPGLPDFANDPDATVEPYYRFRVLLNKRFQG